MLVKRQTEESTTTGSEDVSEMTDRQDRRVTCNNDKKKQKHLKQTTDKT